MENAVNLMPGNNWITSGNSKPFYARKIFELESVPAKAEILICGLGQFNLYVNGTKVSDHVLDPAWSDYNKRVYFLRFDIKPYLRAGRNVLAAEVGNGWFIMDSDSGYSFHFPGFMPPNPNSYKPFSTVLLLSASLEITDENGQSTVISTDESWKIHEHMVTCSNVYGSEIMDGTKRIPGWNGADYDDSSWKNAVKAEINEIPSGTLQEQTMPAVRVIHEYEGKLLSEKDNCAVYDFGQNTSGMLSLELKGKRGDIIKIYPAEKLDDSGKPDQMAKNWVDINVLETCIIGSDDEWEKFSMTFTYIGARYIAVDETLPENIRNVKLCAITSALEDAGSFECDDLRYMQIYDLVKKAVEANMVSVHTDCPTIERFAWQEENHLMAPAIMFMKDVKSHWEKFMQDARDAQLTADDYFNDMSGGRYYPGEGLIPSQAPCYIPNVLPVPGMGDFYDIIGWGSSIIIGTYWHYMFYGDKKIIEDNYSAAVEYLKHLDGRVNADGFINYGLGDWGNPKGEYARENVETAFLYADNKYMEYFAGLLGKTEDARIFHNYADKLLKNYNEKLLILNEKTGRWCYRVWSNKDELFITQASEAMPLFFGMVPEDKIDDVVFALRKNIEDAGSLESGEVGQPYIIQTTAKYGMNELLSRCILKETHPSYYAFVLAGETTLGEYWEENPRSHCHDMMGHIAEWYYNGIGGIHAIEPGFSRILVKPYMPESVNHFKVTYRSASGLISVEAFRNSNGIKLDVKCDDSIEVTIDRSFLD